MSMEIEEILYDIAVKVGENEEIILENYDDGLVVIFESQEEAFMWLNTDENDRIDNLTWLLEKMYSITPEELEGYDNVLHKMLSEDSRIHFIDELVVFINE